MCRGLGSGLEISLFIGCAKSDQTQVSHIGPQGVRKTYNSRPDPSFALGQILRYAAHEQICSLPREWRPAPSGTQNDTREGSRGENRSAQVLDMSHPFISFSCRRQWPWYAALVVLLLSSGLLTDSVGAEERTQP